MTSDERLYVDVNFGMWARRGTRDDMILAEVLDQECYKKVTLHDGDVILDIGGNIGAAAVYFARRARTENKKVVIHSFEPDENNLNVLVRNVAPYDEIRVHPLAVSETNAPMTLWVNENGANKACHSPLEKRGYVERSVQARAFESVIRDIRPGIIKCDIEGGEFLLPWQKLVGYPCVREIVMEIHMGRKELRQERAPLLVSRLGQGEFVQVTNRKIIGATASFNLLTLWKRKDDF